ncbi:MAG: TolC family protein [Gallionellaceae bacterium]|nr:TolC family protein [Gallionellaceae bacterium]
MNPLTLADVVDLTLCNNPQTRAQWASARAQAAQLGVSMSSYLPTFTGQLADSHSRSSSAGTTTSSAQRSASVTASYLLYDFGGRAAGVENAQQLLIAANAARDGVLQGTFLSAVQAYYTLLSVRASVQAYQVAETAAEKSLNAAQARSDAGTATLADRLQARTAWSQAKLNRIRAAGEAANAQGTLANIMGLAAAQPFELVTPTDEAVAEQDLKIEQNIGKLIADARQKRPELLAAEAQIKAAEAQLAAANASGLPSISLNGALGLSKASDMSNAVRSQSIGISLSVPLFTGFKNNYQSRVAQAQLEGKVADRDRIANQIALDVWKAYQALLTNSQALVAANDLLASADQSEKTISGRYQAGLGNILDVLTAQSALASARQQQVSALYDFKASKFVLAQAIGQLDLTMVQKNN